MVSIETVSKRKAEEENRLYSLNKNKGRRQLTQITKWHHAEEQPGLFNFTLEELKTISYSERVCSALLRELLGCVLK